MEVLLTERDMLALEWELHHVRWMANTIAQSVHHGLWMRVTDYERIPEKPTERGQMSRAEAIARRDQMLENVPAEIQDEIERHAAERQWWAEHKATAPINVLRLAVRKEMMRGQNLRVGEFDTEPQPGDPPEEGPRPHGLKWIFFIRASIAERRMKAGQFKLLFDEAIERDPEWGIEHLRELEEEHNTIDFADMINSMDDTQLMEYVKRSEKAAAAYGVTGDHLIPGWLPAHPDL